MAGEPILVVDDNPTNLKLMKVVLSLEGYQIECATDSTEVFATLKTFRPKLILMDLQLPGMDGLEITQKIKADPALKDIQVLAITAYAMKGDEARALAAGCDGYVSKPIDTAKLPKLIREYLDLEHNKTES